MELAETLERVSGSELGDFVVVVAAWGGDTRYSGEILGRIIEVEGGTSLLQSHTGGTALLKDALSRADTAIDVLTMSDTASVVKRHVAEICEFMSLPQRNRLFMTLLPGDFECLSLNWFVGVTQIFVVTEVPDKSSWRMDVVRNTGGKTSTDNYLVMPFV